MGEADTNGARIEHVHSGRQRMGSIGHQTANHTVIETVRHAHALGDAAVGIADGERVEDVGRRRCVEARGARGSRTSMMVPMLATT